MREKFNPADPRSLMLTINRRIEYLASRDHLFGQGFFMAIRTYDDLLNTIRARILPHLRVLFDDDWRKVQLVFSDIRAGGDPNQPQIVGHEKLQASSVLGFEAEDLGARTRYWITPDRDLTPEAFRKVYSSESSAER